MTVLTPEEVAQVERLRDAARSLEVHIPTARPKKSLVSVPVPETEPAYYRSHFGEKWERRVADKTYIIACGPFVKIGIASNVEQRFRSFMAANPFPIEVIQVFAGGYKLERELHRRFAAYRHRDEWFRREGDLAAWIEAGCPL
jgi:hypothetical protein